MKGMNRRRPVERWDMLQGALPAMSLVSQVGLTSAIANDIGAEWVFAQQVYGYGHQGDVLMAISTSGQSSNILRALEVANVQNMRTIGLTGGHTREFDRRADVVISCPGNNAAEIQEQHIKVYHELCKRLEEEFFT
jgi:phosphoheptose isomerase